MSFFVTSFHDSRVQPIWCRWVKQVVIGSFFSPDFRGGAFEEISICQISDVLSWCDAMLHMLLGLTCQVGF